MNPIELVKRGSDTVLAQACGNCGRVYVQNDAFAIRCCDPRCVDCNESAKAGRARCAKCAVLFAVQQEAARIAKATTIPEAEYSGPVYVEAIDRYVDIDELRDEWDGALGCDEPLPLYVWACHRTLLQLPDVGDIVERVTDDSYDGAFDDVLGGFDRDALQKALDAANAQITSEAWSPDYSRRIVLDESPNASSPEPAP